MKSGDTYTTYIIKVSGNCNLTCPYCYYFNGMESRENDVMKISMVEEFLEQATDACSVIKLIWHGGEPLILGIDYFKKIFEIEEKIRLRKHVKIINSIQTNGTLINDAWIEVFNNEHIGLGISLDGPKQIHNINRKFASKEGSFDQVIRGINLLQEKKYPFAILSVVTKESLGCEKEIFDFFKNNNIKRFDFLPSVEIDPTDFSNNNTLLAGSLEKGDFSSFMINIFNLWFDLDDPSIVIRYFDQVFHGLLGGQISLCKFKSGCPYYLSIDFNGEVSPCGSLLSYSQMGRKNLILGNIAKDKLIDIINSPAMIQFAKESSIPNHNCLGCKYFKICGGGCRKYSYMWNGNFKEKNYFCLDQISILSYITETLNKEHPSLSLII